MKWQDYIGTDKDVLAGKPIIKGTRISIDFLIGLLAQGWTEEQILESYPRLTKESLRMLFFYLQECLEDNLLESSSRTCPAPTGFRQTEQDLHGFAWLCDSAKP